MIASRRWLEALLGRPLDPDEVARILTMQCAAVDAVVPRHQDLGDVLVARVLEVRRHPNADRLTLCLVDAGADGGPVEVVCGAPNVRAGGVYPFAPVGAVLPGGVKLERRKIRGVESNGMLCSAKELGLGEDHAGILELDTDAPPGTRLVDALPVADHQIVVDVGANRPDLLCHKGIARELGAALGVPVKLPAFPGAGARGGGAVAPAGGDAALGGHRRASTTRRGGDAGAAEPRAAVWPPRRDAARGTVDGVEVRLEDPEGAPRYMIAVIRGVQVGPSPRWLADRLAAIGQRPINNVVDATNYILFEINQPLHAFDLARLRGPAVVVRRARPGEKIVTLDGVERTLTADMTAICDAERPTIIAGVMGSAESEVSERTTDLVLECAYFQPTRIRRTRRAVGVQSESSYRFERGIDLLAMPDALRRAIDLILAVAGGELRQAPLDLWPEPQQPRTIFLRPERVARLLGVPIGRDEIERYLSAVGFVAAPKDDRLAVQVPGWRPDVTREVDLIEEVARLKGYDTFPDELRGHRPGTVPDSPVERAKARVREALARAGMLEARTIPLGPPDGPDAVAITNPLSAEEAHLCSRLVTGLVRRVEFNWS
ncbi:MAG TPA: phenylalanine--tRNA ligase subunit beta, partial [Gemmatimonadales bacterium]|nr:phenylalanine--tRNA ligase subunit beta [Gemmatimonadales bacterium]